MKKKIIRILTVALFTLCIAGFAACRDGGNSKISTLATPENVYLCHNQTTEDATEYILTWDKVENADEYEITAFGKTFTTKQNSYDFTSFCEVGKSEKYSVTAISETKDYHNSKKISVTEKAEEVTSSLIYTVRGVTQYTASHEKVDVEGRLVFPDTYNGKTVTKIIQDLVKDQSRLTSVRFPQHLTVIGEGTFSLSGIKSVIIPEGVTTIEMEAFCIIETLKNVVFPTTLVVIEEYAFGSCAMENILIPNNVKTIGRIAFAGCDNLKSVTFEEESKLKELGERAFSSCSNLEEITMPDSLQTIGYRAFEGCGKLKTLHIPKGVTDLKGGALFNNAFTEYTVAKDNPAYKAIDGDIYSKDGTVLVQYAVGKEGTEFVVPDGVKKIGDYAFYGTRKLLNVSLPQTLTEIGNYAFSICGITEIELPYGLETIGEAAFKDALNLTNIVLPDSVTSFGMWAFSIKQLNELVLSKNIKIVKELSLSDLKFPFLELPEGVILEAYAFSSAYIPQLILPKDFTCEGILSSSMFEPYIIDIMYKGTRAEWEALKEKGAFEEDMIATQLAQWVEIPDLSKPPEISGDFETYPFPIYYYSENEPPLNEDGTAYDDNYWHYAEDGVTPVIWEK
ncbi:MAG: hypothetical protein E7366_00015 [Clostridiales bacterium]|nr:hypothetical protein [Clostridiales bacterium]